MPYLNCEHCQHEQMVASDMLGLEVRCKRCGKYFDAIDDEVPASSMSPRIKRSSRMSIIDTAIEHKALIVGVACLLFGIVVGFQIPRTSRLRDDETVINGRIVKGRIVGDMLVVPTPKTVVTEGSLELGKMWADDAKQIEAEEMAKLQNKPKKR